jgi:hypothetical protein
MCGTVCASNDVCKSGSCSTILGVEIIKDAVERGWWKNDGLHIAGNDNTLTGQTNSTSKYNSYFIFDLAGVTGTVVTAKLKMEIENYQSADPSESMSVWDVSTAAATLDANGSDVGIYNDLMTGNSYGIFVVNAADKNTTLDIQLNPQAVSDLNAALGGTFSVGLHVDTAMGVGSQWVRFSMGNEMRTHQLVLNVL